MAVEKAAIAACTALGASLTINEGIRTHYLTNKEVCRLGARAIGNLASNNPNNKKILAKNGAVSVLVDILRTDFARDCPLVAIEALFALSNVINGNEVSYS